MVEESYLRVDRSLVESFIGSADAFGETSSHCW